MFALPRELVFWRMFSTQNPAERHQRLVETTAHRVVWMQWRRGLLERGLVGITLRDAVAPRSRGPLESERRRTTVAD